jgi:hypothetical protein
MKIVFLHDHKINSFVLFLMITILPKSASNALAQEQEQALGVLKIQGEYVERLVLRREDGRTERFDKPGASIELPLGRYRLLESHLEGGYICFQGAGPQSKPITIAENEPSVLEVGAPLKQTLQTRREGKVLVLDYKLTGIGNELYTKADRSNPPNFTVYKDNQEIASGRFSYG